jgi:hypothetical protein
MGKILLSAAHGRQLRAVLDAVLHDGNINKGKKPDSSVARAQARKTR